MITVLVGHRGTGKTLFLSRLKNYFFERGLDSRAAFLDLDEEICRRQGRSLEDLIENEGRFREIEISVFQELYREYRHATQDLFLALGAGFMGPLPKDVEAWWIRRESDSCGRIFLNRPRLEPDKNPLEEFRGRYLEREARYRQWAHRQITFGEGWDQQNEFEPALIGLSPAHLLTSIAVTPWVLENSARQELFFSRHLQLGVRYFEFRDDLLSEEQIRSTVKMLPAEKVLVSFRKEETSKELIDFSGPYATDWAIELGPSPLLHNTIVSLHERRENETVDEAAARLLSQKADHHKLAILIRDLTELWVGHRFFLENQKARSFLPISKTGRWQWYRLAQSSKMHLNFTREGDGLLDQPLVFDFLRYTKNADTFAAILGQPVAHSRTPAEQSEFFKRHAMGTLAIPLEEDELQSLNLGILERIGLRAAAVTSPLKIAALRVCDHTDKKAADVGAINTIVKTSAGWCATNTDLIGLAHAFHNLSLTDDTVVWGGSGTRLVLRALFPQARFFSARQAKPIWMTPEQEVAATTMNSPQSLIWAVPRSRMATSQWPPDDWRPQFVYDLNYTEDSPGLEYALRVGARYFSGRQVFLLQAEAQREFWAREL